METHFTGLSKHNKQTACLKQGIQQTNMAQHKIEIALRLESCVFQDFAFHLSKTHLEDIVHCALETTIFCASASATNIQLERQLISILANLQISCNICTGTFPL